MDRGTGSENRARISGDRRTWQVVLADTGAGADGSECARRSLTPPNDLVELTTCSTKSTQW